MAKSRKKRRKLVALRPTGHRVPSPLLAALVAAGVMAAAALWYWSSDGGTERAFLALADAGRGALARVERRPDLGGGHVQPGAAVGYASEFPTSGRHDPRALNPGVYDAVQRPEKIVHALEHGIIVVYVDRPKPEAMAMLKDWAALFAGPWSGLAVVPKSGLGEAVVLTAWNRVLRLDPFEPAAAAAFIDTYRGRGPEQPVR